eukprot:244291_1
MSWTNKSNMAWKTCANSNSLYDEYFSMHSSSSLFKYEPFDKNQTLNYLSSTHSRRTANVYSQSESLESIQNGTNTNTNNNNKENIDIEMNNYSNNNDEDIEMNMNTNVIIKKTKSILGRRSFSNAFQQNDKKLNIQQPFFKKQRI